MPKKHRLSARMERFADEYVVDLNAAAAAVRAGYSAKTANKIGYEVLRDPRVAALIRERLDARRARVEVRQDDVLRELLRIARSDPAELFALDGGMLSVRDMPEDVRRAIANIEFADGGVAKVKLWDKPSALTTLARHLGMLKPDTATTANVVVEIVSEARPQPDDGPSN